MFKQLTGKQERGNRRRKNKEQIENKYNDKPKSKCINNYIKWKLSHVSTEKQIGMEKKNHEPITCCL